MRISFSQFIILVVIFFIFFYKNSFFDKLSIFFNTFLKSIKKHNSPQNK